MWTLVLQWQTHTHPPGLHRTCFLRSPCKRATFACIFKKVNISWGQKSVDAITGLQKTPKEALSYLRSEFMPELHHVDFEVDVQAPADSPPRDHLIIMVKETVKKEFWKNEKKWNLFISLIDNEKYNQILLITRLPGTVSNLQTWS